MRREALRQAGCPALHWRLPYAVQLVDLDYVANDRYIKTGTYDEDSIPYGQNGLLVLSQNKRMLRVQAQRNLIIQHRVGIVFLPQSSHQ